MVLILIRYRELVGIFKAFISLNLSTNSTFMKFCVIKILKGISKIMKAII